MQFILNIIYSTSIVLCVPLPYQPFYPYLNGQPVSFQIFPGVERLSAPNGNPDTSQGGIFRLGKMPEAENENPLLDNEGRQSLGSPIIMPWTQGGFNANNHHGSPINFGPSGDNSDKVDAILFPGNLDTNSGFNRDNKPERKERECSSEQGLVNFNGKCEHVLTEEPCQEGFWLILNENDEATCAQKPCPPRELFYKDSCVSVTDPNVCGHFEILYTEFHGNSYCDCQQDYIYDSSAGRCYLEHERGSCNFGHYLEVNENGNIECIRNPCTSDSYELNPDTGKCHKKENYKGSCKPEDGLDLVFDEDGTALCVSIDNRNIFEVPTLSSCPAGSKRNYLGRCQTVFRFNQPTRRVPSQYSSSRYSSCPQGYTVYPDGSCKKVNPILSG